MTHGLQQERVIVPRRPQQNDRAPTKGGPRINEDITAKTIFLIGDDSHKYGEIGLDEARFDLATIDEPQILDRSLGCLCHRNQTRHAAIAATGAWRALNRARNRTGDDPPDLEETTADRRGADPEETGFGIGPGARKQRNEKQTGAGEAAPVTR